MRLICPNCGAHYAIDPRIIPEAGRDVQCSACGHTWFQTHAGIGESAPDATPIERAPQPDIADPVPPPLDPPKREIDPEVMSVLREEAALERAARRAEQANLEVQGDFDLVAPETALAPEAQASALASEAVDKEARSIAEDVTQIAAAPIGAARSESVQRPRDIAEADPDDPALRPAPRPEAQPARRNLLPDIEEINSTLEPAEHANAAPDMARPEPPSARIARARRGQGRRIGFALACLIFGIATLLYQKGPEIGEAVPAFAPGLETYVGKVQEGRIWLDALLRKAGGVGSEG